MEFQLGRLNKAREQLGEPPIELDKLEFEKPFIENDRLVDKDTHKVIGTKGDMYTKQILYKVLTEGCMDHDPRPRYFDEYKNASYKRYILTEDGNRFVLDDDDIVKEEEGKIIVSSSGNSELTEEFKNAKYERYVFCDGEVITVNPKDEVEIHANFIRVKVPAHTLSVNEGIQCTYDLSKGESPITTLRPQAIKSFIAEILWIYRDQSTDLVEFDELLGNKTWDDSTPYVYDPNKEDPNHKIHNWWEQWALRNPDGSYKLNEKGHPYIGTTYGEIIRRREMIKKLIEDIKNNPDGRRNIVCMWQVDDFKEPHGLKPCAYETLWNVRHGWDGVDYLDMTLHQRSSDFCTAGCINQAQYVALQIVIAAELNLQPGYFTWKPTNVQIYDRHINQAIEMLGRDPVDISGVIKLREGAKFATMTADDIYIEGLVTTAEKEKVKKKNPQLKFPIGV